MFLFVFLQWNANLAGFIYIHVNNLHVIKQNIGFTYIASDELCVWNTTVICCWVADYHLVPFGTGGTDQLQAENNGQTKINRWNYAHNLVTTL